MRQHTNTKLAEVAAAFVARVRDRGPAGPRRLPGGLGAAGQGVSTVARCGHRWHRPPIRADRPLAGWFDPA
ncbi:hypothetical protein [Saccharopolyspora hordei]|uniref:Uncharacterized protein n=1 Tax=Saccharopolyspora hordei TaxID=1838 RepID=A0A853AN81_9PSEU|nr:hypothetical protein [Saccharopolyspora hordei]NYI84609.1 hypothetical protein [Saccharopolyspora hordei]